MHFDVDGQTAVIGLLHKVGTHPTQNKGKQRNGEQDYAGQQRQYLVVQAGTQCTGIESIDLIEQTDHILLVPTGLYRLLHQFAVLHMHFLGTQQFGTKHRGQCNGYAGGSTYHNGHNPTQRLEHDTGNAVEQRKRYEHHDNHQRGGQYRHPNLVGGVQGRLTRIGTPVNVPRNILQHHDGVIDHHTDGDGERAKRNDVDGAAGEFQVNKGYNQGNRDGDADDEGRTPASEEEEYHQHYEEQGVQNGFLQ